MPRPARVEGYRPHRFSPVRRVTMHRSSSSHIIRQLKFDVWGSGGGQEVRFNKGGSADEEGRAPGEEGCAPSEEGCGAGEEGCAPSEEGCGAGGKG